MIDKTEAIVLKITPYSRTSHVVAWLTPKHGRLTTVVKGACRPRSPFLGQYDLFYTCELLYYTKERNGIHIARECSPLDMRKHIRSNWRTFACASYICDLIFTVSTRGGHEPELYGFASDCLDFLCRNQAKQQLLLWFELRLAGLIGLAPQFTKCVVCDSLLPVSGSVRFSASKGGTVCAQCCRNGGVAPVDLPPDVLALFRSWQAAESPRLVRNTQCSSEQLSTSRNILGMFLRYHLETANIPASREIAFELMMSFRNA